MVVRKRKALKGIFLEEDIRKYNLNIFRFFYYRVTISENLEYLILQTHIKTKGGFRTIVALGTDKNILFSTEINK